MGLLQKATEQNSNSPLTRKSKLPEIKDRLNLVKNTINFYPSVFKEFVDLFYIQKGALLIKDGEMFSLSSIIGYDETTNQRLRISCKEFEAYNLNNDITILQKYFSIREFVTTKKILIIPFENNNKIESLLLITEFKTDTTPTLDEIKEYTNIFSEFFNDNPLNKLKDTEIQNSDIKEGITSYLQKIKNAENRIIFLKLNINSLLIRFKEDDSLSTTSSIKNSVLKMLTSFSKNRGKVFQLYNNDILITLLDKSKSTNIMVVQQQINAAFKSIFSTKIGEIDLNFETLIWDKNSLETILDHFIQNGSN